MCYTAFPPEWRCRFFSAAIWWMRTWAELRLRVSELCKLFAGQELRFVLIVQKLYINRDNVFLLLQYLQRNVIIKETGKPKIVSEFPEREVCTGS